MNFNLIAFYCVCVKYYFILFHKYYFRDHTEIDVQKFPRIKKKLQK